MDVSEAKWLKALAKENAKLKKRLGGCGRATPDSRHPAGNPRCKRPSASSLLERGR
jgi:hypothetical protein